MVFSIGALSIYLHLEDNQLTTLDQNALGEIFTYIAFVDFSCKLWNLEWPRQNYVPWSNVFVYISGRNICLYTEGLSSLFIWPIDLIFHPIRVRTNLQQQCGTPLRKYFNETLPKHLRMQPIIMRHSHNVWAYKVLWWNTRKTNVHAMFYNETLPKRLCMQCIIMKHSHKVWACNVL